MPQFSKFIHSLNESAGMDKAEMLAFLKTLKGNQMDNFRTISDKGVSGWVIDQYREYLKTEGFPYTEKVKDWIIKQNDLSLSETEIQALGTMVYFAAEAVRKQDDTSEGWVDADLFDLEHLATYKNPMEIKTSMSGAVRGKIVKSADGSFMFLPTGKKKKGYAVDTAKLRRVH